MSSILSSIVDQLIAFVESAYGIFTIACIVALSFLYYSYHNYVGTIALGIYYFGVVVPVGLFFWSATKHTDSKIKIITAIVGVAFLVWSISDAILRHA